jgi:hypothetical protein
VQVWNSRPPQNRWLLRGSLKWYLMRGWARYYANPKSVIFPRVCPVCLGPADTVVEEDSASRTTANYVVWREYQWWTAKIPHCSACQRKQVRDLIVGLALGAACGLTIFILTPAPDPPGEIAFYAFFAYPFYVIADYARKGISLGRGNSQVLNMRIRHAGYYDQFLTLNSQHATAADVPLAGNKGVWRH